jgi:hypothetical protein
MKRYCNNNFNDIFHAMVLLFELMVVNQWHDILCIYDQTNFRFVSCLRVLLKWFELPIYELHSFKTCFVSILNDISLLAEGFVIVTNMAARLCFITFHLTCVIITLKWDLKYP